MGVRFALKKKKEFDRVGGARELSGQSVRLLRGSEVGAPAGKGEKEREREREKESELWVTAFNK